MPEHRPVRKAQPREEVNKSLPLSGKTFDLMTLTQKEEIILQAVLQKEELEMRILDIKISEVRKEIQDIRKAGALTDGDDQDSICARCKFKFPRFYLPWVDHGERCSNCKFRVCTKCCMKQSNGSQLCILCFKNRQEKLLTGEWMTKGQSIGINGSEFLKTLLRDKHCKDQGSIASLAENNPDEKRATTKGEDDKGELINRHRRESYTQAVETEKSGVISSKVKKSKPHWWQKGSKSRSRRDDVEPIGRSSDLDSEVSSLGSCSSDKNTRRDNYDTFEHNNMDTRNVNNNKQLVRKGKNTPAVLPSRFQFRRSSSLSQSELQGKDFRDASFQPIDAPRTAESKSIKNILKFPSKKSNLSKSDTHLHVDEEEDETKVRKPKSPKVKNLFKNAHLSRENHHNKIHSDEDDSNQETTSKNKDRTKVHKSKVNRMVDFITKGSASTAKESSGTSETQNTTEKSESNEKGKDIQVFLPQSLSVCESKTSLEMLDYSHGSNDEDGTRRDFRYRAPGSGVVVERLLLPSKIKKSQNPFEGKNGSITLKEKAENARHFSASRTPLRRYLSLSTEDIKHPMLRKAFSCVSENDISDTSTQEICDSSKQISAVVQQSNSLDSQDQCKEFWTSSETDDNLRPRDLPTTSYELHEQATEKQGSNLMLDLGWTGSDVSDTLSIVTEVPDPRGDCPQLNFDFDLDSDDTLHDTRFEDSLSDDNDVTTDLESSAIFGQSVKEIDNDSLNDTNFSRSEMWSDQKCPVIDSKCSSEIEISEWELQNGLSCSEAAIINIESQEELKIVKEVESDAIKTRTTSTNPLEVPGKGENYSSNKGNDLVDDKVDMEVYDKFDEVCPMSFLVASAGKDIPGKKPTLLSLAMANKEKQCGNPSQISNSSHLPKANVDLDNSSSQRWEQTHQRSGSDDQKHFLEDESMKDTDSGITSGHTSRTTTPEQRGHSLGSPSNQTSVPVISVTSAGSQSFLEEDDDLEELFSNRLPNQLLGSRSSLADSRESIYSVYSDAGEVNYGRIPVTGEIMFHVAYNHKTSTLEVHVKQCRDLAPVDTKHDRSDPYVKTYLLPDKSRGSKRKTRIKKHTLNPVFDEVLKYQVSSADLESRSLWLTVWHNDRLGRNDFLGEVTIPLDYYRFDQSTPMWYPLMERAVTQDPVMFYKGDLSIALKYVPADMVEVAPKKKPSSFRRSGREKEKAESVLGEVHVLVREAQNLTAMRGSAGSNPFCKGYLLPDVSHSSKQKTPVIKKTTNPQWQHILIFEGVDKSQLHEYGLELTVWDYEKLSSNDFLGGVRLNLGQGIHNGKPADWMDARGEEIEAWHSMIEHPNEWIDSELPLRASMGKQNSRN